MRKTLLFSRKSFLEKHKNILSDCTSFDSTYPFIDKHIISNLQTNRLDYREIEVENLVKHDIIHKIFSISNITSENISLTFGAQHALFLILLLLQKKNKTLLLERYNYIGLDGVLHLCNISYKTIPMLNDLSFSEIESFFGRIKPDIFYIQTTNSNPTTQTLSIDKRRLLIQLSRKYKFQIIEDLTYYPQTFPQFDPIPPLFEIEPDIISIGSLSKLFCPALRMGWVIAKRSIIKKLDYIKEINVISHSSIICNLVHKLMQNYSWWHKKTLSIYQNKLNHLVWALETYLPSISFTQPKGGSWLWIKVDDNKLRKIINDFRLNKVFFTPGYMYDYSKISKLNNYFFRLSVSELDEKQIERGIKKIADSAKLQ